jgi:hypothetical protein
MLTFAFACSIYTMSILVTTAYLPPASYMAEVIMTDEVVIEVFETYQKQSLRNHCTIYGPNGRQILSIPVVKVNGNHTRTRDIRISDHQPWQRIHWRSITTAYNNSPFFLFYQDLLAPCYEKKFTFLVDWNMELLLLMLRIMKVERHISMTSTYEAYPERISDLRLKINQENKIIPGNTQRYTQVFEPRHGFIAGLSVIDLIFNLGPEANDYICKRN